MTDEEKKPVEVELEGSQAKIDLTVTVPVTPAISITAEVEADDQAGGQAIVGVKIAF